MESTRLQTIIAQIFAGYKTFTNEFIAYERLGVLIENSEQFEAYNGSYIRINDDIFLEDINATLVGGVMQVSEVILCTFVLNVVETTNPHWVSLQLI